MSPSPDPSTYYRRGFGLAAEVHDDLSADYDGRVVDLLKSQRLHARRRRRHDPARPRVRVLLRRRARGGVRLPDAAQIPRPAHLPRRRDHPQPARQRPAARDGDRDPRAPEPTGAFDFSRITPEDVVILPAFGVTIDDFAALRDARLHARRHDVRLGAQRLEARRELRARRIHGAHPRQVLPRGDARDGVAGAEVSRRPLPDRPQHGRSADRLRLHRGARVGRRR